MTGLAGSPVSNADEYTAHVETIASRAGVTISQAAACIRLLSEGSSIPFIARYRKERTGSLDEVKIRAIAGEMERISRLEARRETILTTIREAGKLTPELANAIRNADTLTILEDMYLPYRPRRRTRADIAREKGLEPLAASIRAQKPGYDPCADAEHYTNPDTGVLTPEEALEGAQDIIAADLAEDCTIRSAVRALFHRSARILVSAARGRGGDAGVYQDLVGLSEPAGNAPSHRILAIFRGERDGFLSVHIAPGDEDGIGILTRSAVRRSDPAGRIVAAAATDGYRRLLAPAIERELRSELKEKADETAAGVFSRNLQQILLAPPLGPKKILAIDPGIRTGCKLAVLGTEGQVLWTGTIYPHTGSSGSAAGETIRDVCIRFSIEVIAVGDGTAGRETWTFLQSLGLPSAIRMVSVSEQGASIYSASDVARAELPDLDVSIRGAVSIGRRLLDPLAELVKIEPRSLGVGQYQHDVDQELLGKKLTAVVTSAVHSVGVNLNTASPALLAYVSGLTRNTASAIIAYREANGRFALRKDLLKVRGIGEKTFEQAAGFLRIAGGSEPLDHTGIHPERYPIVEEMAVLADITVHDLIHDPDRIRSLPLEQFITADCGLPTLIDIREELLRPGRDPRGSFVYTPYENPVTSLDDLIPGMELSGVVTNVTNFGAFISLGIKENGLVHISEMADRFVRDPGEIVRVSEQVRVRVIAVDSDRRRITLSMKGFSSDNTGNPAS